jgi:hypothetical protein
MDKGELLREQYLTELGDLSSNERDVILPAVKGLIRGRYGYENRITKEDVVRILRERGIRVHVTDVRLYFRMIRLSGEISGVVNRYKGYYIATDKGDMGRYVRGELLKRARKGLALYYAMEKQYLEFGGVHGEAVRDEEEVEIFEIE